MMKRRNHNGEKNFHRGFILKGQSIMKKVKYKGKNRYKEFLSAAKIISKKISKIEGVVGILATGGIGRGYCDDYSDLDLIVYAKNKKFQPYLPKWLFYHLENNFVPEAKYLDIIKKVYLNPIKTAVQAKRIRTELIELSKNIGIKFNYENLKDIFKQDGKNWEKASEKTKYYLSW